MDLGKTLERKGIYVQRAPITTQLSGMYELAEHAWNKAVTILRKSRNKSHPPMMVMRAGNEFVIYGLDKVSDNMEEAVELLMRCAVHEKADAAMAVFSSIMQFGFSDEESKKNFQNELKRKNIQLSEFYESLIVDVQTVVGSTYIYGIVIRDSSGNFVNIARLDASLLNAKHSVFAGIIPMGEA